MTAPLIHDVVRSIRRHPEFAPARAGAAGLSPAALVPRAAPALCPAPAAPLDPPLQHRVSPRPTDPPGPKPARITVRSSAARASRSGRHCDSGWFAPSRPTARASASISVTFRWVALANSPRRNAIASALAELKPGAFLAVNSRGVPAGLAGANVIAAAFSRRTISKASVPGSPESSFLTCSNSRRPSSFGSISTRNAVVAAVRGKVPNEIGLRLR